MENVSNRIAALSASQTLAMTQKARELKAKGINVISLSVGEPDFNTPDYVKEAAKKAIDDNYSYYTAVSGYDDLLKAISDKFKRENNLDYATDQIIVSGGAKQSITNALLCLLNPGDEVLIPTPYWVSYPEMVKLAEAKPVYITTKIENDFKVTPEQIAKAITPRTKMFIFSSPSNPAGTVYSKDELKAIADVFAKNKHIFILSDEIYEHITFGKKHESIAQFPEVKEQSIIVNGVSKSYAMTGWRIGYLAAAKWIVKACDKLQGQYTSNACSIAQKATVAALNGGLEYPTMMKDAFERRRDLMVKGFSEIEGLKVNVPEGAFYIFPDFTHYLGKSFDGKVLKTSSDIALYLLDQAAIASVSGDGFGQPECIRFSFATSDDKLVEALGRIKAALGKLQ
jgi:aspartate aminotransferase